MLSFVSELITNFAKRFGEGGPDVLYTSGQSGDFSNVPPVALVARGWLSIAAAASLDSIENVRWRFSGELEKGNKITRVLPMRDAGLDMNHLFSGTAVFCCIDAEIKKAHLLRRERAAVKSVRLREQRRSSCGGRWVNQVGALGVSNGRCQAT